MEDPLPEKIAVEFFRASNRRAGASFRRPVCGGTYSWQASRRTTHQKKARGGYGKMSGFFASKKKWPKVA
jgi:hypothetical protein